MIGKLNKRISIYAKERIDLGGGDFKYSNVYQNDEWAKIEEMSLREKISVGQKESIRIFNLTVRNANYSTATIIMYNDLTLEIISVVAKEDYTKLLAVCR